MEERSIYSILNTITTTTSVTLSTNNINWAQADYNQDFIRVQQMQTMNEVCFADWFSNKALVDQSTDLGFDSLQWLVDLLSQFMVPTNASWDIGVWDISVKGCKADNYHYYYYGPPFRSHPGLFCWALYKQTPSIFHEWVMEWWFIENFLHHVSSVMDGRWLC